MSIIEYIVAEPEASGETLVTPPHNVEAEEAVLGAVLINPSVFPNLATILQAQDFFIHRNRVVWEAFTHLYALVTPIDNLTVSSELIRVGKLEEVGGDARLTRLLNATPTSMHAGTYAQLVKDQATKRNLLRIANQIASHTCSKDMQSTKIIEEAMANLGKIKPTEIGRVKTRWDLAILMSTEFPDLGGPIPGLIPPGLTIFGGRPKRGKSLLMLQASCTLAIGGKIFGRDLQKSRVLYYALEDPPCRLKERVSKLGIPSSALLDFALNIKPLHLGGISEVEMEAKKYQMIVIDTLRRALPGKDFVKDGPLFDEILGRLQSIAQSENISIIVILHTRKMSAGLAEDPVDDILGTTGLTASADCVLALYKTSGSSKSRLLGRQRDGPDIDLELEFDPITCSWQLLGETGMVRATDEENAILDAIQDLGKSRVSQIADAIGKDRSNTSRRCASLNMKGLLKKERNEGTEYYYLPNLDTQGTQPTHET